MARSRTVSAAVPHPLCLSQANPCKALPCCAAPCPWPGAMAFVSISPKQQEHCCPAFPLLGLITDHAPVAAMLTDGWFPGKMGELWEAAGSRSRWVISAVQSPTSSGSFWPDSVAFVANRAGQPWWEGKPWAGRGCCVDLVSSPPQSPGCIRRSVREV